MTTHSDRCPHGARWTTCPQNHYPKPTPQIVEEAERIVADAAIGRCIHGALSAYCTHADCQRS